MKAKLSLWLWALIGSVNWLAVHPAQAAVDVYGEASSSGALITVQVFADISGSPLMSFGVRLLHDPRNLRFQEAAKNTAEWFFFDGKTEVPYRDPEVLMREAVLMIGGKLDGRDPLRGVTGNRILLGTARFSRLTRDTPKFEVTIGYSAPYANFVTPDGKTLENQPGAVAFKAVAPTPGDVDLDGLNDDWEIRYFGSIEKSYFDEDYDRDGFNNLVEQALGSDPSDSNSNLRVSVVPDPQGVQIEWPSARDRVYTIETAGNLRDFSPLQTGIQATPPVNRYLLDMRELKDAAFYRVLLQDASGLR